MIKSIQILLVIIFSNFCFGQNESENIKSEAEKVFYDIVNVYKSEDCEILTSYLNDSILIINSPKDRWIQDLNATVGLICYAQKY